LRRVLHRTFDFNFSLIIAFHVSHIAGFPQSSAKHRDTSASRSRTLQTLQVSSSHFFFNLQGIEDIPTFQGKGLKVNIQKNGEGPLENKMFDLRLECWNVGMPWMMLTRAHCRPHTSRTGQPAMPNGAFPAHAAYRAQVSPPHRRRLRKSGGTGEELPCVIEYPRGSGTDLY